LLLLLPETVPDGIVPEPVMEKEFPELSVPKTPNKTTQEVVPPVLERFRVRKRLLEKLLRQANVSAETPYVWDVVEVDE